MVENQGTFQTLSSIAFETLKSQKEEKQKKHDFMKRFLIFKFLEI